MARPVWHQALLFFLALMLLAAVFWMYLQPEMMLILAQQLWSCF